MIPSEDFTDKDEDGNDNEDEDEGAPWYSQAQLGTGAAKTHYVIYFRF